MRNRAKCKNCHEIIESFHSTDYVQCKCKEIAVDGGEKLLAFAKDWSNFLRVNDNGEETPVKVIDKEEDFKKLPVDDLPPPNKQEKIDMLKGMIDSYERLPTHAMSQSVSNDDMAAALLLIYEILKE